MEVEIKSIETVTNLIKEYTITPLSFRGFSASILPATVGAPGFDLKQSGEEFNSIDWSLQLKMANASMCENFIVEKITSEWVGEDKYLSKSDDFCTRVHKIEKGEKEIILTPFLLKSQSEMTVFVEFSLLIYKLNFFNHLKRVSFKRGEIKEPETYHKLYKKNFVKIKINGKWRSIILKPTEFLVAGDILIIPDK